MISVPIHQAKADPVTLIVVATVVGVVAPVIVAVDYYTCIINIIWGGCGGDSGAGPPSPTNNSSCLNISKPASIGAGQQFFANVTMENTGTKVWNSDASPHALGSQNPQDNGTWGLGRVGLPTEPVNPGQSVTLVSQLLRLQLPAPIPLTGKW